MQPAAYPKFAVLSSGAAEITSLRLAEIAFDSKTLRVIAEADGMMNVYLTALPGL